MTMMIRKSHLFIRFLALCLLLCPFPFLDALTKDIYIVPYFPGALNIQMYRSSAHTPVATLSEWQLITRALNQRGYTIKTSNLSQFRSLKHKKAKALKNTKYLIFMNIPDWTHKNWKQQLAKLPKKKLILIAYEPPSVKPEMYTKEVLQLFGKVLTWDDDLVDNTKFFKINYPVLRPMITNVPSFSQKKLLTQFSANKLSIHPNELYSERKKVIEFFETKKGNDFEFYGPGWKKEKYRNYRGVVEEKLRVLKNYRFSICYENIHGIKGYITEKIFDCFAAGCVPIYWGASTITHSIPANCFIARQNFASIEHLLQYLKGMPETKYNQYLDNIRRFLASDQAQQFSKQAFAEKVITRIR